MTFFFKFSEWHWHCLLKRQRSILFYYFLMEERGWKMKWCIYCGEKYNSDIRVSVCNKCAPEAIVIAMERFVLNRDFETLKGVKHD